MQTVRIRLLMAKESLTVKLVTIVNMMGFRVTVATEV